MNDGDDGNKDNENNGGGGDDGNDGSALRQEHRADFSNQEQRCHTHEIDSSAQETFAPHS